MRSRRGAELLAAMGLLTRLPLGRYLPGPDEVDQAQSVRAYPLVGGVVGLIAAMGYALASEAGMSPLLAAFWALVVNGLVTGALHEDGLADSADGLAGGQSVTRRLEIMRDSRIGSYGALALMLSLGVRGAAIAALGIPGVVAAGVVSAGMLGRMAMVLVMWRGEPARRDGLAAGIGPIPRHAAWTAAGSAALVCVVLLGVVRAVLVLAVTGGLAWWWRGVGRRAIGGYTGDTLGGLEIIVECVVLSLLAGVMAKGGFRVMGSG
ncbi:adenosylcobinamide-GDP ribazoletransferase [Acidiphilium acidophilum]|uniref:Adenosylcobinamide-GDP ribazoletransferase n=1 Tax=Acidiphilium acidophilum TaxID=76588 RepID=A0AAW9DS49_ACIAO|nr:adenosylcobinamide-GDP ribazoletransferase [Acidiphilium acidophilum]MDX5931132.1 adenosylcobinamide-GDP ribazoletransferase [Acidiphilium acidophilum]